MGQELAYLQKPEVKAMVKRSQDRALTVDQESFLLLSKKPLLALPPELRGPMLVLWSAHKHLYGLDTALPLSVALAVWVHKHGLRVDDAIHILEEMMSPSAMAGHERSDKLMVDLAARVSKAIRQRRAEAEAESRRTAIAEAERDKETVAEKLDELKQKLAEAFVD